MAIVAVIGLVALFMNAGNSRIAYVQAGTPVVASGGSEIGAAANVGGQATLSMGAECVGYDIPPTEDCNEMCDHVYGKRCVFILKTPIEPVTQPQEPITEYTTELCGCNQPQIEHSQLYPLWRQKCFCC